MTIIFTSWFQVIIEWIQTKHTLSSSSVLHSRISGLRGCISMQFSEKGWHTYKQLLFEWYKTIVETSCTMKNWEDSQSSSCLKPYPFQFSGIHTWPHTQLTLSSVFQITRDTEKSLSPVRLLTSFQAILQPAGLKFFKSNCKLSLALLDRDYEILLASKQCKIIFDKHFFPYARWVKIWFYIFLGAFQILFYLIGATFKNSTSVSAYYHKKTWMTNPTLSS